ncbi:anthocyanidin 3-O-glucosyltransferase 2-like [Syzygium oleosum]|uniref:anthocyanidin 3-O-glucosyltransferase 2-like n=1 Tax=Syzygium oleosum TaxID=219896 RepID=UPI0024B93890|nr:anthocyanidin 3-O-glucosyltransferase 2-like [Syzygium oleosum]
MSTTSELVFVPCPGAGHLASMVEMAKLLVDRDNRLSVTILIVKFPFDSEIDSHIESLVASVAARIRFVLLPRRNLSPRTSPLAFIHHLMESHKSDVQEAVAKISACGSPRLAGLVVDMFCTSMIDVAVEFDVPSYMFFTSGAAFLGIMLHLQSLQDEQHMDLTRLKGSDTELDFPCFANPLPAAKFLPLEVFMEEDCQLLLRCAQRFRETKGILVNTLAELEPRAIEALAGLGAPAVYPVGPILNIKVESKKGFEILNWLDQQPDGSVVFLCFGSKGTFEEHQAKEIAHALEQSGYRFLWSLRRPPAKGKLEAPCDYADPAEVLPEGFLNRTAGVGRVIGWAPQVAVLAHSAIGGFVSHCGWNSTLESIWFGVPIAAWPQYAEQQFNAFQLVVELGLAAEIKMDYRRDLSKGSDLVVTADEIEGGIRKLMEGEEAGERRKKVKEVSEKSRKALTEGGSSSLSLARFIEDVWSQ